MKTQPCTLYSTAGLRITTPTGNIPEASELGTPCYKILVPLYIAFAILSCSVYSSPSVIYPYSAVLKLMKYNSGLVTSKDNHEMTPLHLACLDGHISIVHIYKDHSHLKLVCEWRDAEGNTPLHLACSGGSAGIVKLLINSKADAKATNKLNEMPLHIAVHCGHVPIAQFLIENRVPMECKTAEDHTPLHCAARKNNTEMIMLLVERYVLMHEQL